MAAAQEEEKKSEEEKKAPQPVEAQRSHQQVQKVLGIGFCVIPLYKERNADHDPGVKSEALIQGSPRLVISGKPLTSFKRSQVVLKYEIIYGNQEETFKNLMFIVPSEILVGPNDKIPGLKATALSARFVPNEVIQFSVRKTIFAHNIRITSINEIEDSFKQYLRKLCMKSGA